ncbi:caspase family protein, partial [Chitinophaga sp.]|uniref:caspase family protein n=1 Tax=Chitinophaga sp. TaxID=1869181 RepID=UPI002628FE20
MQERRLYAAFAGINAYPDSPLSGCIQDVLRVDRLLRSQCAAQEGLEYRPAYYLQPNNADLRLLEQYGTAAGAPLAWLPPTFENFTTRLFTHFAEAKAGDICVFFYSGHGSQTAAPPEFHFNNPSRRLQTIVCADSRTTARDLTNKEMAYLLWQAFGKTEAHCLVITDCCHSGGNTRALAPQGTEFRPRFHADAGKVLAFTDLLGHDAPGFYTNENGEMKPAIARYVHLAACRADELAQESWRGGIFTGRLMEALLANGGTASYRDLMWRMQTVVTAAAGQQHPVAFAATEADLDRRFLSDAMQPVVPSFDVLFDVALNRWKIFGGMLHGLTPGALLDIRDGDFRLEAELREVEALFSLIDIPGLDTTSETAKATMIRAAAPALLIASPPDAALEQALAAGTFPLLNVGFGEEAGYEVFRPADGSYVLLEKNGTLPLFRRTASAAVFLSYAQRVAAWMAALDWKRLDPRLGRGHFELQWTAIDGFGSSERALHADNDTIELKYKNGESPAFRLGIALKADAPVEKCFVRVLYLGSKYDIFTELIRDGEPALERGGAPLYLTYIDNGKTVSAIPVSIDELYPGYNRYEISDYLKIIVSAADFRVGRFAQEALELDRPGSRGIGGVRSGAEKETGEAVSWSVFHCRICTAFEGLEKSAGPGGEVLLGPLAITTPAGFSGKLALLPERKAEVVGPDAWGDAPSENGLDGGMAALRLEMTEPLRPEDPLFLLQASPKAAVRSLPDHTVIPFVTAAGGKAYEPAGFQDAAGRIQIFHAPTPNVYFRRIYLPHPPTGLRI